MLICDFLGHQKYFHIDTSLKGSFSWCISDTCVCGYILFYTEKIKREPNYRMTLVTEVPYEAGWRIYL